MLVKYHAAVSTLAAGGVYLASDSLEMAGVTLAAGVLVDIDHAMEYVREYGFSLDIRRFFRLVYQARYRRVIYLLHAWEWVVPLAAVAWATGGSDWSLGLLVGYLLHLGLDQVGHRAALGSYSLLWRWRQGFDHVRCFPGQASRLTGSSADEG